MPVPRASKVPGSIALFITIAVGVVVATPAASFAKTPGRESNRATGHCLDSNWAGDVYAIGCNGGTFQIWNKVKKNFGYALIDVKTGLCLDDDRSAGRLKTNKCNYGSYQQWTADPGPDANPRIWKSVATMRCLDDDISAGKVKTNDCNGGNFQRWQD